VSQELDEIERLVEAVESKSSAEVVVSFSARATDYRDVDLAWAILFGLSLLAAKIWSTHHFHPDWVVPNVVLVGLLGFFLSRTFSSLKRLFISSARAQGECCRAAQAQFTQRGITQTSGRTGLLIQVFRLERRIELVPDSGLSGCLSPTLWSEWAKKYGRAKSDTELLANLKALLHELQGPLSRHLPRGADDLNELPNRPLENP
jgi:putative membrane protein